MNTSTTAALGMLVALLFVAGAAAADPAQETSRTADQTAQCPPVWFDSSGQPHFDPDCVNGPLFDNSP